MKENGSAFKISTGTPTGKRTLVRPKRRWEDNVRMGLKEIGINTRNWVDPAQYRDYWIALYEWGIEPSDSISHRVNKRLNIAKCVILICKLFCLLQSVFY